MNTKKSSKLSKWIEEQLDQRGWTQGELARRSDLSSSTISEIITGRTFPGLKFCTNIAEALQIPLAHVLRLAEILPPLHSDNPDQEAAELVEYFNSLDPPGRTRAISLIRTLYRDQQENTR